MRLRQIALVGRDLAGIAADIDAILAPGVPYADPGVGRYGLRNLVWPLGATFLEVVSPARADTTAGRLLAKRGADGGYMTIFQVADLAAAEARARAHGVRIVERLDLPQAAARHLHPKDLPGAIVSIDAMQPPASWAWGGPEWRANARTTRVRGIVGAGLAVADSDAVSARWAEVLGLARRRSDGFWRLALDGGELRFAEAADGAGLNEVDLEATDRAAIVAAARARGSVDAGGAVRICGVRLRLV